MVNDTPLPATLFGGHLGTGWLLAHLHGRTFTLEEDVFLELDGRARMAIEDMAPRGAFDLISGIVGVGVYALERSRSGGAGLLTQVVGALARTAERQPDGVTWLRRPDALQDVLLEQFPEGAYDLGLAHGVAGVVAFLAAASVIPETADAARELLRDATSWLLAQSQSPPADYRFPHFAAAQPVRCRIAWCYGDLGVAVALLHAGRQLASPPVMRAASETALLAASRASKGVVETTGLCHGNAGVAHVLFRLGEALEDPLIVQAARRQLAATLRTTPEEHDYGLLTGETGIALTLLDGVVEPSWDSLLLLSVPRSAA